MDAHNTHAPQVEEAGSKKQARTVVSYTHSLLMGARHCTALAMRAAMQYWVNHAHFAESELQQLSVSR